MILRNSCLRMLCVLFISITVTCACDKSKNINDKTGGEAVVGGPCSYESFTGKALISKLIQTEASKEQAKVIGGPGYEGFEVWFRFVPDSVLPEKSQYVVDREHLFTLYNSWYVGPEYIEKYDLGLEKTFPCTLKVIKSGTCNPVVFEFPSLDQTDYFESRAH